MLRPIQLRLLTSFCFASNKWDPEKKQFDENIWGSTNILWCLPLIALQKWLLCMQQKTVICQWYNSNRTLNLCILMDVHLLDLSYMKITNLSKIWRSLSVGTSPWRLDNLLKQIRSYHVDAWIVSRTTQVRPELKDVSFSSHCVKLIRISISPYSVQKYGPE